MQTRTNNESNYRITLKNRQGQLEVSQDYSKPSSILCWQGESTKMEGRRGGNKKKKRRLCYDVAPTSSKIVTFLSECIRTRILPYGCILSMSGWSGIVNSAAELTTTVMK